MHWEEKASFTKIWRLLEISEQERHHEVLLTVKNLHDLSRHPSPYNVLIIPRPLPLEIVESENFVIVDLLSLIPSSYSLAREAESEAAGRELVIVLNPRNVPLLTRIPALPLRRSGRLRGVAIWSVLPWKERAPVLPPKHRRKRRGR